jgi:hypothetical protein
MRFHTHRQFCTKTLHHGFIELLADQRLAEGHLGLRISISQRRFLGMGRCFFLMTISTTPIYPKPHPVLSQATEARPLWACAATPHLVGPRPGDTFPPGREHHSSRARRNQMTRRTFTAQRTCPPRSIDWANLPSWLIPICSSQFSGGRPAPTAACQLATAAALRHVATRDPRR